MTKKARLSRDHKNLVRRYLLWAYKSTKESFERIERKTTQLLVDDYILDHLTRNECEVPQAFRAYISDKRKDESKLKFADEKKQSLNPEYLYLKGRLTAIEAAIRHFLGKKELELMHDLYEKEFIRRILEAKDH